MKFLPFFTAFAKPVEGCVAMKHIERDVKKRTKNQRAKIT